MKKIFITFIISVLTLAGINKNQELNNMNSRYDIFYPKDEFDLVWVREGKETFSGKKLSEEILQRAIDNSTCDYSFKRIEDDYDFKLPELGATFVGDDGHNYVITRHFYASWRDYSSGRERLQIYDLDDNQYYYIYNVFLDPSYTESGEAYYRMSQIEDNK